MSSESMGNAKIVNILVATMSCLSISVGRALVCDMSIKKCRLVINSYFTPNES
jgi:hypothetical protein